MRLFDLLANLTSIYRKDGPVTGIGGSIYNGNYHLENWVAGDFNADGKDDVLFKFNNLTSIYRKDGPVTGIGGSIYNGNYHLENWVAGDFNADGKDDVLFKFNNLTSIYKKDGPITGIGGSIYNGSYHLHKFLVDDFSGDGKDDAFFQYVIGNDTIVYFNANLGQSGIGGQVHRSENRIKNWLSYNPSGGSKNALLLDFEKANDDSEESYVLRYEGK